MADANRELQAAGLPVSLVGSKRAGAETRRPLSTTLAQNLARFWRAQPLCARFAVSWARTYPASVSADGHPMTEKISDAVVIHGPGRSGTTLLSQMLSTHSDFAWISGYVDRFPGHPVLAVLNRVMSIDVVERLSRPMRYWPRPAEAYMFWNHYFPYFSEPEIRSDKKPHDRPEECIRAIRRVQQFHGKQRFITKVTGAPRARELARSLTTRMSCTSTGIPGRSWRRTTNKGGDTNTRPTVLRKKQRSSFCPSTSRGIWRASRDETP